MFNDGRDGVESFVKVLFSKSHKTVLGQVAIKHVLDPLTDRRGRVLESSSQVSVDGSINAGAQSIPDAVISTEMKGICNLLIDLTANSTFDLRLNRVPLTNGIKVTVDRLL